MATPASAPQPGRPRRTRTRLLILIVAAIAGIGILAGCNPYGSGVSALTPGNRPTNISGASNGYVPLSMRANVNSKCSMYNFAAGPLAVMIQGAAAAGVQLWTVSCYRTYQGQVLARQQWCAVGQCYMAATPGYSNHGWGKAVDLGEPGGMTFSSRGYRWLKANAGQYGYLNPAINEAWHWEWVGDGGQMHGNYIRSDLWFWYRTH